MIRLTRDDIAALPPTHPFRVVIPGPPCAQGRGRAVRFGSSVRVIDPEKSRSWKGAAQVHMLQARQAAGVYSPLEGPVAVTIRAYWPRPKSMPKRLGSAAIPRPSRPDCDNCAKATFDAGNGVLWADDAQIVRVTVEKWVAAAGEGPRVELVVEMAHPTEMSDAAGAAQETSKRPPNDARASAAQRGASPPAELRPTWPRSAGGARKDTASSSTPATSQQDASDAAASDPSTSPEPWPKSGRPTPRPRGSSLSGGGHFCSHAEHLWLSRPRDP